jgi:DNA-binding transcriptional LysR family regulator
MVAPNEVEQGVLDGSLHVGVVPQANALSGLEYQSLYSERSLLYCAVGHPLFYVDDGQLDDDRLAEQEAIAPTFRLPADVQAHYQALKCTASASDREGMAFLILTGRYIGYLPDHYASFWVQQGRLRALKPPSRFYDLSLVTVTRKGRRPHLVLESFLESLAATR